MGTHKSKVSQDVINAIEEVGRVIGYHICREWPIPGTGPNPQAIDICWFFDKVETSPLFAFEVESKDTSAAQGNANKLFAKSSEQLQKPLFFFHLFLDGPNDNTRKDDLLVLYGRYNYCVYDLSNGCLEALLDDIIRQHRRLTDRLPLFALADHLKLHPEYRIDLSHTLQTVSTLGFERGRGTLLSELGDLLIRAIDVRKAIHQELTYRLLGEDTFEFEGYETWLGQRFQEGIHWAILANLDQPKRDVCIKNIIEWQGGEGSWTQPIDPEFLGRRNEYDNFVLCWSPALWALLVALVGDSTEFRRFVCEQIDRVVRKVENSNFSIYLPFAGLWMLLISIWDPALKDFSIRAKDIIQVNGGVPATAWTDPPSILQLEEGSDFPSPVHESFCQEPLMNMEQPDNSLREQLTPPEHDCQMMALTCAFKVLIKDDGLFQKGNIIAGLLSSISSQCTQSS